jgi:hypothetical protein
MMTGRIGLTDDLSHHLGPGVPGVFVLEEEICEVASAVDSLSSVTSLWLATLSTDPADDGMLAITHHRRSL